MPLHRLLKLAIVAEIVFVTLAAVAEFAFESRLPEPLRDYLAAKAEADWSTSDTLILVVGTPLLVAAVVSWVGLWRLWPVARPIYLYSWIASWVLFAFSDPVVSSALADTLWEIAAVVAGFTIALIYCSELRHAFVRAKAV